MRYPSVVYGDTDPSLGEVFPTYLPQPEVLVYQAVADAAQAAVYFPADNSTWLAFPVEFVNPPLLNFYADNRPDSPAIPINRGWPAYPGKVPAIGVALGNDSEDDATDSMSGGFAGTEIAYDDDGNAIGTADYYSEPLYSTVVVELIHENRDERDRLHELLRRVLFPLRRRLVDMDRHIRRVRIDAEKQELPIDEQPLVIYISLFTVHVYYEMLEAVDVTGTGSIIEAVNLDSDVTIEPPDGQIKPIQLSDTGFTLADLPAPPI